MASNLATIRVELIANAQKFKSNIDKASSGLKKLDKSTTKTSAGSKKMQNSLRNLSGSIAAVQGPLGPVAGRITAIGAIMGRVKIPTLLLTGAFVLAGVAITKFAKAGALAERQALRLDALIKATGGAAGQTAIQIEEMAVAIGRNTLASVQGARDAAGVLLTFKSISGETFTEALKLTQDLAEVGFGTMKTAALQLGKALEEPEIGMSALRRVGVSFTEQQKETIKVLSLTGQQAKAQAMMLGILKSQVGGAGEAGAGGLSGAFDTLGENINLFFEKSTFGTFVVQGLTDTMNLLAKSIAFFIPEPIKLAKGLDGLNEQLDESKLKLELLEEQQQRELKSFVQKLGATLHMKLAISLLNHETQKEIDLEKKKIEAIEKAIEMEGKSTKAVNKSAIITKKHLDKRKMQMEDEMKLATTIGAKQKFVLEEQMKLRDKLIAKLGSSAEAMERINEILEIQTAHFEHSAEIMIPFREELEDVADIAKGVADEMTKVGDTVVDAFLRGKAGALDFKNILRELIISIQKTIIQTLILDKVNKFVNNTLQKILNPTAVTTGAVNSVGGRIPAPGDGMAGGGTVQGGTPTLVGERGPELFVPNTGGSIKNNADTKKTMSGGGGVNIVQNLNFAVGVTNTVRAEVMNMLPAIQQSTVQAVADAKQRGGKFSKAFGS